MKLFALTKNQLDEIADDLTVTEAGNLMLPLGETSHHVESIEGAIRVLNQPSEITPWFYLAAAIAFLIFVGFYAF